MANKERLAKLIPLPHEWNNKISILLTIGEAIQSIQRENGWDSEPLIDTVETLRIIGDKELFELAEKLKKNKHPGETLLQTLNRLIEGKRQVNLFPPSPIV